VDIGAYDSCSNGCIYCYANSGGEAVRRNVATHHPDGELLIGQLAPGEEIRQHKGGMSGK
jgi:DNA repair photolyase